MTTAARAYTDRLSYERGDRVTLHVDAPDDVARVSLHRLLDSIGGPSSRDRDVVVDLPPVRVRPQDTAVGSYLVGQPRPGASSSALQVTLGAFVWFGRCAADVQTVVDLDSQVRLELRAGGVAVSVAGSVVAQTTELTTHSWYLVAATIDAGTATAWAIPVASSRGAILSDARAANPVSVDLTGTVTVAAHSSTTPVRIENGAIAVARDHFTGKVESPFVGEGALDREALVGVARAGTRIEHMEGLELAAAWDLAPWPDSPPGMVRGTADGQADAVLVNGPSRGVTGRTFTGRRLSFTDAPEEYAAIHFHSTDLLDAGWDPALTFELPKSLESGVYGVRVEVGDSVDTVPITVAPRSSDDRRDIVLVLPTFTYLAYANEEMYADSDPDRLESIGMPVPAEEWARAGNRSFGLSLYDTHRDGSGVMFSTARRPIVNFRRGYASWIVGGGGRNFSLDMAMVEWLDRRGIEVDVITDFELHERGSEYLAPYAVVMSGSHPEYTSEQMLDALTEYRDGGGSIAYLGGNGWYWVTGVYPTDPLVVEIRRGHAGIRKWESMPGEVTLYSTGDPAGLWRHRGRPPQELVGVGFAAQGWGDSTPFRRLPAAQDPQHAWIFEGVGPDPIGDYGSVMGGAAGDEVDRADHALGTPVDAALLATSSGGHSNAYQRVLEEIGLNRPDAHGGQQDPEVRADIVYFRTQSGGEVFSTGSIAWFGALLHREGDNAVSRITENVLRRFVRSRRPAADQ